MAIGVMLSGIFSGLGGVVWMLASGFPVLLALVCYPVLGLLGAGAFIMIATLRHMMPVETAEERHQMEPATQG
ncbi:MAG: hypothetical protein JNN06_11790 [Gemmobacter sp.]|uniref:hypothetical protein n=1 Tax=Gemmobacter sp. TaxID=1898957 RepID=UPI001A5BEDA5|nr:hypothetical protein [Gemmobacter sp.]MBL8562950.1 hypothetical protein [Gemmobacter sp.]